MKAKIQEQAVWEEVGTALCSLSSALSYSLAWDAFPHTFLASGTQSLCSLKTWHLCAEWEGSHWMVSMQSCSGDNWFKDPV